MTDLIAQVNTISQLVVIFGPQNHLNKFGAALLDIFVTGAFTIWLRDILCEHSAHFYTTECTGCQGNTL